MGFLEDLKQKWNKKVLPIGKTNIGNITSAMGDYLRGGAKDSTADWWLGENSIWGSVMGSAYNPKRGKMMRTSHPSFTDATRDDYIGTQLYKTGMYEGGEGLSQYGGYNPMAFTNPEDAIKAVFGGAMLSEDQRTALLEAMQDMTIDKSAITMGSEAASEYKGGRTDILRELLGTGGYQRAQTGGSDGYSTSVSSLGQQESQEEMKRFMQPFQLKQEESIERAQGDITKIINMLEGMGDAYQLDMPNRG